MKVTKYPQSCLVIEDNSKRLIIDPGSFVSAKYKVTDLLPVDGILITHEHADHADPALLQALVGQAQTPVVSNQGTRDTLGEVVSQVVKDQEEFELAGFKIKARELPHCLMVDGSPGPQNTGFVIDSVFFHPGDGIAIEDLKVDKAAVPIVGPDISPHDVHSFIRQVGCSKVIPIHYDYFPNDPEFMAKMLGGDSGLQFVVLANGESADV